MAKVVLRNLRKNYGEVLAVDSVNLTIEDKEFFALLGPSGCGKSSTLRMIAGLEEITAGDIFFDERRVTDLSARDRDIAMAFENYALYPYLNVYRNIAFPLEIRKVPREEIDRKVRGVAKFMGLTDILKQNVKSLSGGQQQRTGVARALIRDPSVFLLDEPISHLEAELRTNMRTELRRIHEDIKVTTVYVTHDQAEAMTMADRIGIMNLGMLQQVGTPQEVYSNPVNVFVAGFVGEPSMNFLDCLLEKKDERLDLKVDGRRLGFPKQYQEAIRELEGGDLRLGIRASDIGCSAVEDQDGLLMGEVVFVEPRNEKVLINIEIGGTEIIAQADSSFKPKTKTTVYLRLVEKGIHLFDPTSGDNLIRAPGG
jgi:multiple sugar transport system ATP-binding protein